MFHTICLFKNLSLAEYQHIDITLPKFSKPFLKDNIPHDYNVRNYELRRYAFANFKNLAGISMYLTKKKIYIDNIEHTKSYLHLVINPKVILNKDYISVANEKDAIFALYRIDKLFNDMKINLTCSDFSTSRIDCCFNHCFYDSKGQPSEEMARDYLELLKRGKNPAGFELCRSYSKTGKRYIPYENSLVYRNISKRQQSNKGFDKRHRNSVVINIYNKYEQLKEKVEQNPNNGKIFFDSKHYADQYDDTNADDFISNLNCDYESKSLNTINDAKGIIRIEVQCHYRKLYNTTHSSKCDFDSLNINNFISDSFTTSTLIYYLRKISFVGDYYTLEEAKRKVIESNINCHVNTKNSLLALLTQASKQKGWKSTEKSLNQISTIIYNNFEYKFTANSIKNLINWLNILGVNIVTIPRNSGYDCFLSPINLVSKSISANIDLQTYINPTLSSDDFGKSIFN